MACLEIARVVVLVVVMVAAVPGLTREDAMRVTNADVIRWLPSAARRRHGTRVLRRFSEVFNAALPLVENLYECQRNPFLDRYGNVDLSGLGGQQQQQQQPTEEGDEFGAFDDDDGSASRQRRRRRRRRRRWR